MTAGPSAVRAVRAAVRLPAAAVVSVLRLWQMFVSPVYGQTCRFYPSCTAYAIEAVRVHGLVRGGWLSARRLGRCHPWNPGGVDHVPARGAAGSGAPAPHIPATRAADHRPPRRAA